MTLSLAAPHERGDPGRQPLDVRLAVGAGCAWIATVLLLDCAPSAVLAAAGAAVAAAVLVLAVGRQHRAAPGLALALFVTALVLLLLAGRIARARASPLTVLAVEHASTDVELTVAADPQPLAATGDSGAPRVAVAASPDRVWWHRQWLTSGGSGTVLVLGNASGWRNVLPGQRVLVSGGLAPPLGGGALSVTLFARAPPRLLGHPPWYQQLAGRVRAGLRAAAAGLPGDERGLLPGLVDGDTSQLDPALAENFRLAGLTHLVAVSGTNCSLVVGAALLVLRRMRVRPWLCALLGGAVLAMFVVVARPSPSVLRAALMAAIALVSLATGRPRAALPSLAAVIIALLVWEPTLATSASFTMSVLATGALLLIAPSWAAALRRRRVPAGVAESVAVAAAAHLVTAPVVAAISGRVSLVAVVANVLAEPVVAVTTVLGFAAALFAPMWLGAAIVLAWLAGWPCRWLVGVANACGGLHGAVLPWPGGTIGGLALLALLAALWLTARRTGARRVLVAAAVTASAVLIPVRAVTSGWPPPGWAFVACDVGQGDALVLRAGAHAAVEVDAGPDPVLIDRCLHGLGITDIPLLVLTHMHVDHVGGLPDAVRGRRVGALLTGPLDAPETGSLIVHAVARQRELPIRVPAAGSRFTVGAVRLQVLAPPYAFTGTRSDPNNSSLVLRATVAGVRILLTGDAELEEQDWLLGSGQDLRADVLKVPHHGSAYSDPAFLAAVHASVGVISVGAHNDYGQPSPLLLAELARLGVPALRTDLAGDVAVAVRNGRVQTVAHGVRASTPGLAQAPLAPSPPGARMAPCPPVPSPPRTCPAPSRRSSCWSATRSCSSIAPSARSPPRPHPPTRRWSSPSVQADSLTARNCTSCSVHRCSASRGW